MTTFPPAVKTVDGTILGSGALAGYLFANTNDGRVVMISAADPSIQQVIASGGSRGDFAIVDPSNDTILLTQTDRIERLSLPITGVAASNVIEGNVIGINAAGTVGLANAGDGIDVLGGAHNNAIGGLAAGAGNVIAGNAGNGVYISDTATQGNGVLGNAIFGNGGSTLLLGNGGNGNQADPILTFAGSAGGTTTVTGSLTGTPNTSYIVQFFASASASPAQGQTYLGQTSVPIGASGTASFTVSLSVSVSSPQVVTATATDTATGDTSGFSTAVTLPDHLGFIGQPSNTLRGSPISPAVTVGVYDRLGTLLTSDNGDEVTLSVSGPGGFDPASKITVTVSGGIATFSNLILDTAGSYTLVAASGSLGRATSSSFMVSAFLSTHLGFLIQPSSVQAGQAIGPAVQVEVLDPFGNVLTSDNSDQVTLTVASGPGGFDPNSTTTAQVIDGIATFNNLVFDTAGTYVLAESGTGGLVGLNSNSFTVGPAGTDHLQYLVQPSDSLSGLAIAPAVTVEVLDKYDNLVTTDDTDQLTLTVASGPGGFDPNSTTTVTVSGGIATFSNLVLDTEGTYTLAENGTDSLTGPDSDGFTIVQPFAAQLGFLVQPASATAGAAISPAIQVQVVDQFGNLFTADNSDQVTLSISSGPGAFANGSTTTAPVTVIDGIATFSNLLLDTAGSYTLSVSATGELTGPNSSSFTINPAGADHLGFLAQPGDTTAGVAIGPAVEVSVLDKYGNVLVGDSIDQVTLTVGSGLGGFAGGNALTETVNDGLAVFGNLILHTAGSYTLVATATDVSGSLASASFTVNPAAGDYLSFGAPPGTTLAGVAISPAVTVQLFDQFSNLLTGDNSDAVTLTVAAGPAGFAAGSSTTAGVAGGVATFSDLAFKQPGTYTLLAGSFGDLVAATTSVTVVTPPQFQVTLVPASSGSGQTFTATVTALLAGRPDTGYLGTVVLTSSDPQAGSVTGTFASGDNGTITLPIVLYTAGKQTVTVSDATLSSDRATSKAVTVGGLPPVLDHFVISGLPATDVGGVPHTATITAVNKAGQIDTNYTGVVTLTSGDGSIDIPVHFLAKNRGAQTVSVVFSTPGDQTLTATGDGKTGTLANIVVVSAATHLSVAVPPGIVTAGNTITLSVTGLTFANAADTFFDDQLQVTTSDPLCQVGYYGVTNGVEMYSLTFYTAGAQTITVTDLSRSALKGPGQKVIVTAAGAAQLVMSGAPLFAVASSSVAVAITAEDPFGNQVRTGFTDQVTLSTGQTATFLPGDHGKHVFLLKFTAPQIVALTASDSTNSNVTLIGSADIDVVSSTVGVSTDPTGGDEGQALVIVAPAGGASIVLTPANAAGTSVAVTINGKAAAGSPFALAAEDHIIVYGQTGNDIIQEKTATIGGKTATIAVPAILLGGRGNNTLSAAGSSVGNVLVGGAGKDSLTGGSGADVLIGGGGADTLHAGSGGDVLIGGSTTLDANLQALAAVLAEWDDSSDSYTTRVQNLFGTGSGGLNGSTFLDDPTVINDAAINQLFGGSGQDWFWLEGKDKISGVKTAEIVTSG